MSSKSHPDIERDEGDPERLDVRGCPVLHYNPHAQTPLLGHTLTTDDLREQYAIFKTTYGAGYYNVTRYEDVYEALRNPSAFSASSKPYEPNPKFKFIPTMIDPPEHTKWRQLLAPYFSPNAAEAMSPRIRQHCISLIERLAEQDGCDIFEDFALQYPTVIFLELVGLPVTELDRFNEWVAEVIHRVMHLPPGEETSRRKTEALGRIMAYFEEVLEDRRASPRDDLLTHCLSWEIDGEPIPMDQLVSMCLLLLLAGLETVASQLAYTFFHFATNEEHRKRIVAEPAIIPGAVEELLRYYSFINVGRKVVSPVDLAGIHLEPDDMVSLWCPAASRDPRKFESPEVVDFDRTGNVHLAFGAGAHRCPGSHLARVELRIAIEEWHKRIPDYRLDETIESVEFGLNPTPKAMGLIWSDQR